MLTNGDFWVLRCSGASEVVNQNARGKERIGENRAEKRDFRRGFFGDEGTYFETENQVARRGGCASVLKSKSCGTIEARSLYRKAVN